MHISQHRYRSGQVPDIGTVTRSRLTSVISGRQENQKKLLLRADKDDGVAV
jgi:hypothetical protein